MIKIRALNEESSEESEGDEDVPSLTKEAQEQAAFTRYNEALGMIRENNLDAARVTLQELLEHNFLLEVQKQERTEGLAHPALILKYSCLKNMGTVLEKQGELQTALQHYLQAAELDGTDVSLWYRVGTVAISVIDYELACDAFLEGLRCSSQHWPCLDSLITVLYILNDYIPCLLYISRAFELDPDFLKGQALRDKIVEEQPSIIDDFNAYCKGYELGQLNGEYNREVGKEIVQEALDMREKKRKLYSGVFTPKPLETICLVRPLLAKTWLALGESLVQLHRHIEENDKIRHFCCPVDLESIVGMVNGLDEHKLQVEPMNVDQSANEEGKTGVSETVAPNGTMEDDGLVDGAVETDDNKTKKKRRSSLSFLEQWMWGGKRRSARVRSTVKREAEREDGSNLEEALRRLVPQSLLPKVMKDEKRKELEAMKTTDESLDTMDLYKLFERRESTEGRSDDNQRSAAVSPSRERGDITKVISEESYFGTEKETKDVEEFISSNTKHDIIDLLLNYVKILSKMRELTWPEQQTIVYLDSYQCMRKHVQHPSVFSSDEDTEWIKEDSYITLLFGELFLDRWRQNKEASDSRILTDCMVVSSRFNLLDFCEFHITKSSANRADLTSLFSSCFDRCEDNIPAEAIGQLVFVSVQENLLGNDHLKFILRLYWLKAHVFLNQGAPEVAMESLNTILLYLDEKCEEDNKEKVFLPNCKHHNVINIDVARKLLAMLTRNRSLCEVQHLYDDKQYEELVEILKETFHYSQQSQLLSLLPCSSTDACPDRATQLAMLMDALCKLKRYEDCFYWGEACCNEALHKYLNSEDKEQTKWASTVEKLLSGLESCVNKAGLEVIDNMPTNRLTRLVQNLTHTVCHQLEAPESAVEMPIESISPWILLQQILQHHEERKSRSSSDEDDYQENARSGELPGLISVLFTAHEFLGRRSWCCSSEGALLLHTMDVVIPRLRDEKLALTRDKMNQGLEQVFYCLYAHPNKKTKARYLQDHGVPQISLTWERGMQLYQFYQPEELPEFDSYRVISITADVESLYRRIASLIPAHCNPAHLVEKVVAYIEGTSPSLPVLGDARSQLPRSVSAIYYLLADYYFKANEWGKAIRHYLLDVCVNPVRIDSWAGMALARGSLLETKLNSCEPLKSEMDFLKQAASAQRCFQRALDIEANHSLMWIEFGSFVYMVHSFCSRLLKQETDCLSLEMFEILENRKERMLDIAVKCFTAASRIWYSVGEDNGIQDERWLHQYMLGKVAEKRDHNPSVYLGHFSKAAEHLHENRASYAHKISYNNPQNLSVEALEVYYRIHACILKYLEQNEGKKLEKSMKKIFEKLLKTTAEGPFMAVNTKETDVKIESDEERRKRTHLEALEDVFDDVTYMKKARLDLPLDICLMEDVIDVMEGIICKVVEIENNRKQSEEGSKKSIKTEVVIKQEPHSKDCNVKDEVMEIIILEDSLPKVFESLSEDNLQVDPLSLDADNNAIKKELKEEIEENLQLHVLEGTVEKLDAIDLAMEVVEEIVDDIEGDIEMEQDEDKPDRSKTTSHIEGSECSKMQVSYAAKDIPVGISVKVNDGESKFSQLMMDDKQLNDRNVDGEDGDDEGDDGDDEYDDDDDKMDVKDKLLQENIKPETDRVKLPEHELESVVNAVSAVTANRQSSQESSMTTTTTTETSTANSSSSSSDSEGDSSSSNDDSSSSSSSSDSDSSDSNSDEQNTAVKTSNKITESSTKDVKKESEEEEENGNQDHYELVKQCLVALEECVLRFPQHYKSLYRLTHYYFHSKFHRNISKCQDLLLGTYKCLPLKGRPLNASFQGLFADRKSTNFFNGVWRIPVSEIDRPGSFASHMSRCVLLLMEVLHEVKDHRMLLELCLQLKRTPEADKKYLRDTEREQLCRQALALALQAMRTKLREGPVTTSLVLEMYRAYQRIQRHLPQKEAVFASLLSETYQKHTKVGTVILDQAIRFCQQEILASRAAANPSAVTTTVITATLAVTTTTTTPIQFVSTAPVFSTGATITTTASPQFQRKMVTPTVKTAITSSQPASRPRGRPPNVSRVGKSASVSSRISATKVSLPQLGSIIPTALSTPGSALPFYAFPGIFTDPSLINAAVQSKLPNMLDQQVLNFLNRHAHVGGYQAEFLRHFVGGNIPSPLIPSVAVSQSQKSPGTSKSSSSTYKVHTSLANPQTSTPLPPSISITPLPSSQMPAHCNTSTSSSASTKYSSIKNPKTPTSTPSLQQKLQASQALAKSASSRSSPLNLTSPGKTNTSNQPSSSYSKGNMQKSTPLNITSSSYVKPRDQIPFSNQPLNSIPYTSLLKGGEGMLTPGVSISQVTSAPITTTTTTMKPSVSKLMNFRKHAISLQDSHSQEQSSIPKDVLPQYKSSSSSDNTKLLTSPVKKSDPVPSTKIRDSSSKSRNQSSVQNPSVTKNNQNIPVTSTIATSKSQIVTIGTQMTSEQKAPAVKNKSPENKDSSIFKNQSGTKRSRSPGTTSTPIRNIGPELTLTPALPQPTPTTVSTISMLSRLQQQSSDLEIFSAPKPATLDLSVQIPSSITITPKQQGNPSPSGGESFRPSAKKFKDTVSITEVGKKVPNASQNQKRTSPSTGNRQDKAKPDKKEEKPAGGDVEIITLE